MLLVEEEKQPLSIYSFTGLLQKNPFLEGPSENV